MDSSARHRRSQPLPRQRPPIQVADTVAETVSATSGRNETDSAPVRVRYRARPNSFSAAYRTSASHLLRLTDIAAGKPIGSGAHASATTNWRGRFPPFLTPPNASRYATISTDALTFAHDTRARAGLPDRPKLAPAARTLGTARRPTHAHEPRNNSWHARLRRADAAVASRPPPARLHHRHDRHRQDGTPPQHDARRPPLRRRLLLSRSAWRREPAHCEPRSEGARQGRDLPRPVRRDPHLRL